MSRAARWMGWMGVVALVLWAGGASAQTTTAPGTLTGTAVGCKTVNLSATFTGDSNANGSVAIARGSDGVTFGTSVCSGVTGVSPRTCADSTIAANTTYYYRATFTDADGIVGGATRDTGAVAVGACAPAITVTSPAQPAAVPMAQGSSGVVVGKITLTTANGTPTLSALSLRNGAAASRAIAGADVSSLGVFDVTSGTSVFVGASSWNAATSNWDFTNLGYKVSTTPSTLNVALNVNGGATVNRQFAMVLDTNDVSAIYPQDVTMASSVVGNTFTIAADPVGAGSTASTAPMVSILTPVSGGVVSGSYLVRVRVFNAIAKKGIPGITGVRLSTNNGASYAYTPTQNANYNSIDPVGNVTVIATNYEYTVTSPTPGAYTLRAQASNGGAYVNSEPVQVTVAAAGKGDGNLLVRDNSSQLCTDCHAVATHSSEAVGNAYGAWAITCRDCHSPHGTRNILLIKESISPPSVNGKQTAKSVGFVKKTGDSNAAGWNSTSNKPTLAASYTNSDNSGPCQVCHTRTGGATPRWRNTGNSDTHYNTASGTSDCASCHLHKGGFSPAGGDCVGCHGSVQPKSSNAKGLTRPRRAIVPEFGKTWSHKRAAGGTVTKYDCCVCHMEGDVTTGNTTGQHMDGFVDLRDPDTGVQIQKVTFGGWTQGGATPGSYTSGGGNATASEFVRNLTTTVIEPFAAAVMINQCLHCHDANGATNAAAQVPGGSATKPFGTTISNGSPWYKGELTAGGAVGGVANVDASFNTTNASYHPIKGKQNNSYIVNANMVAPWNGLNPNKTNGNLTSWGFLMTCWDCHTDSVANVRQTYTITAHGGSVTVRSPVWVSNATAAGNLCRVCHFSANHKATGSATASIDSNPTGRMQGGCFLCHGSNLSGYGAAGGAMRPIAGQDAHGFDAFSINNGTDRMWPVGAAESFKPYGFMRNAGPSGQWRTTGNTWAPNTATGWSGGAKCDGTACRSSHGAYTPGGVY